MRAAAVLEEPDDSKLPAMPCFSNRTHVVVLLAQCCGAVLNRSSIMTSTSFGYIFEIYDIIYGKMG